MGKPAARIGDSTAHGGKIVKGKFNVLIGGRPAARITDFHVCPMVCPGPVPHVGGPIIPPCAYNVLIGSLPAARISDKAICACAIDSIVTGKTNVLIGTSSSGMPVVPSRIPRHTSVKKKQSATTPPPMPSVSAAPSQPAKPPKQKNKKNPNPCPKVPPAEKQELLDYAGLGQGAQAPSGASVLDVAQQMLATIKEKVPKSKWPHVASVAVDKRTGKVYYGINGDPQPEVADALKGRVKAREGKEPTWWPSTNCAEFFAANVAAQNGARVEDLEIATYVVKKEQAKERCPHCQVTTDGASVPTDAMDPNRQVQAPPPPPPDLASPAADATTPDGPKPGRPGTFHGQEQTMSCGIASCRMVIESVNKEDWPEATLRSEAESLCGFQEAMGTPFYELPNLLNAHGINNSGATNASMDDLAKQADPSHPAIVDVGGHAIVVDRVSPGPSGQRVVQIRDPYRGPAYVEESQFAQMYQGQAITTRRW